MPKKNSKKDKGLHEEEEEWVEPDIDLEKSGVDFVDLHDEVRVPNSRKRKGERGASAPTLSSNVKVPKAPRESLGESDASASAFDRREGRHR